MPSSNTEGIGMSSKVLQFDVRLINQTMRRIDWLDGEAHQYTNAPFCRTEDACIPRVVSHLKSCVNKNYGLPGLQLST